MGHARRWRARRRAAQAARCVDGSACATAATHGTRREFLASVVQAGAAAALTGLGSPAQAQTPAPAASLARFRDLPRHFVFEYYPWYASDPWRHWQDGGRRPPDDLASNAMPRLGAYDSRARAVLEQHARWIVEAGVGALDLSWWGAGSFEDRAVHGLFDVLRDHGLKATFHLEPYGLERGARYADDVLYLLREYGDRRSYDTLLLLEDAQGRSGPVFKGFAMVLPETRHDCHGVATRDELYVSDDDWARANERLRRELRSDFDHVTLLCDTLDVQRARRGAFDGLAVYDNFVPPADYALHARRASAAGLLHSFNVNAGFDFAEPRQVEPDACYRPQPFAPPAAPLDWSSALERERAAALGLQRIDDALAASLRVQTEAASFNAQAGFFLAYVCTFNEWHEGTAFEPQLDGALLSPAQRAVGYHNPARGDARLALLRERLLALQAGAAAERAR